MDMRVISADSHMMEPADLWETRLDSKFRDRAPKVIKSESGKGYLFIAPGVRPFPVAGGFGIGKSGEELKEHLKKGYEAARPSGWDPAERIKDQDIDGVQAEVIYTTLGMPLFGLDDDELRRACFAVYNDWVAAIPLIQPQAAASGRAALARRHPAGGRGAGAMRETGTQGRDDLGCAAGGQALL